MDILTHMTRELEQRFIREVTVGPLLSGALPLLARRIGPWPGKPGAVLRPGVAPATKAYPEGQRVLGYDGQWYDYNYLVRLVGGMDGATYDSLSREALQG